MKELSTKICKLKPSGIREFFNYASERPDVISLGVGEPDFVTPTPIIESAKISLDQGKTFYTSNQGLLILRQKISNYLISRFNVNYFPDEILLTSGSSQGILSALMAIINPGDEVIVTEPSYICYAPDIEMCGGVPIIIPLTHKDEYKLKPEILSKYITKKTKALILCYPNNPTGATMGKDDLKKIAPIILNNDLYILSDEIYAELTYCSKHCSIASLNGFKERTILIGGFSKAFAMTGWRLGYVCASNNIMKEILKIQQYIMLSAPTMSQYGALAAIDKCESYLESMVKEYNRRRIYLLNEFKKLKIDCFEAKGAFYLFPSISSFGMSSRDFCLKLLKDYNVLVVPGTAFGDTGEGYIRISYATDMNRIKKFIDVLKEFKTNKRR